MTEKTEYIAASIDLLEQEDELNSTELAVLCNLKKYMNKADHQPTFEVGEYVAAQHPTNGLTVIKIEKIEASAIRGKMYDRINGIFNEDLKSFVHVISCVPATAKQIAEFKLAEAIANTGQSADQIRQMLSAGKMPMGPWLELQKTAEELQEVNNNE